MPLCIEYRWTKETDEDGARQLVRKMRKAALKLPFKRISKIMEDTWGPKQHPKLPRGERRRKGVMRRWPARWFVQQKEDDEAHMQLVLPQWSCYFVTELNGCDPAYFGLAQYPVRVDEETEFRELAFNTYLEGKYAFWCKVETIFASLPQFGGWKNFLMQHKTVIAMLEQVEMLGVELDVWDQGRYWETTSDDLLRKELEKSTAIVAATMGELKDAIERDDPQAGKRTKKGRKLREVNPLLQHPQFEHLEAKGRDIMEESARNMPPWMREMLEGGEEDCGEDWKRGNKE